MLTYSVLDLTDSDLLSVCEDVGLKRGFAVGLWVDSFDGGGVVAVVDVFFVAFWLNSTHPQTTQPTISLTLIIIDKNRITWIFFCHINRILIYNQNLSYVFTRIIVWRFRVLFWVRATPFRGVFFRIFTVRLSVGNATHKGGGVPGLAPLLFRLVRITLKTRGSNGLPTVSSLIWLYAFLQILKGHLLILYLKQSPFRFWKWILISFLFSFNLFINRRISSGTIGALGQNIKLLRQILIFSIWQLWILKKWFFILSWHFNIFITVFTSSVLQHRSDYLLKTTAAG